MTQDSNSHVYLLLSRGQWDPAKSKEEIQAAIDQFYAWYDRLLAEGKFKAGHRLSTEVRVVSRGAISDGPFPESKEIVGGYWFIVADSLDAAARVAAENPCLACGLNYEIRPLEYERATAFQITNETPAERR